MQFIIFLTIFLTLYGAMNYYALRRVTTFFSLERNVLFYLIFFVLTLSYLGATILERYFANTLTRAIYTMAALWMGIVFILFFCLLASEIPLLLIKPSPRKAGTVILIIAGVLSFYSLVNAAIIHVRKVRFSSEKIPRDLKIVHLSDLHFGPIRTRRFLARIVEKTNSLHPDAVFITGDMIDGPYHYREEDFAPLSRFEAPVYFVTGNHERYGGLDRVTQFLEKTPLVMLRNKTAEFEGIEIIGIDDADKKDQVERILPTLKTDPSKFRILLYHRPIPGILKQGHEAGIDLVLSGHVHAGQIFPFNFVVALFYRPVRGFHEYKGARLNVSTGTGTWGPPMRLGSRSEIVLIHIEKPG